MSPYTPGPWFVVLGQWGPTVRTAPNLDSGAPIAEPWLLERGPDEQLANAHVLATAPELLEVVRAFLGCNRHNANKAYPERPVNWCLVNAPAVLIEQAAAAIAKAEGRAPEAPADDLPATFRRSGAL